MPAITGSLAYNREVARQLLNDIERQEKELTSGKKPLTRDQVAGMGVRIKCPKKKTGRSVELLLGVALNKKQMITDKYEKTAREQVHARFLMDRLTGKAEEKKHELPAAQFPKRKWKEADVQAGCSLQTADGEEYAVLSCSEAKKILKRQVAQFELEADHAFTVETLSEKMHLIIDAGESVSHRLAVACLSLSNEEHGEVIEKSLIEQPESLSAYRKTLPTILEALSHDTAEEILSRAHLYREATNGVELIASHTSKLSSAEADEAKTVLREDPVLGPAFCDESKARMSEDKWLESLQTVYETLNAELKINSKCVEHREFEKLPKYQREGDTNLNLDSGFKQKAAPSFSDIPTLELCAVKDSEGKPIYPGSSVAMLHGDYMALQGPTDNNSAEFWSVLADNKVPVSVSLTRFDEDTVADPYPDKNGQTQQYGNHQVKLIKTDQLELDNQNIEVHHLLLDGKPHTRICLRDWKDMTGSNPAILAITAILAQHYNPGKGVISVNCRAGVGRTCTLIGVSEILKAGQARVPAQGVNTMTACMRRQRGDLSVQRPAQYETLEKVKEGSQQLAEAFRPLL